MDQGYGSVSTTGYGSRYGSGGMDRGVWIVCGFGALIHTLYFDSYPYIYIYHDVYVHIIYNILLLRPTNSDPPVCVISSQNDTTNNSSHVLGRSMASFHKTCHINIETSEWGCSIPTLAWHWQWCG